MAAVFRRHEVFQFECLLGLNLEQRVQIDLTALPTPYISASKPETAGVLHLTPFFTCGSNDPQMVLLSIFIIINFYFRDCFANNAGSGVLFEKNESQQEKGKK